MLVSGRNNVREILRNLNEVDGIKKAYCQDNFDEKSILSMINSQKIPLIHMKKQELDALAHNNHQGIILDVRDFVYKDLDSIISGKDKCIVLILDHLEDPHNLGAIVRTVEASGIDGIILPINRSVSVNETVMKTSVGSLYNVNIASVTNLYHTIDKLKKEGFWIVGTDMNGEDYAKINYPSKVAIIIGNEGAGMQRLVRESCDFIASIPMYGKVNSLNASVAAGIMIYEVIKHR